MQVALPADVLASSQVRWTAGDNSTQNITLTLPQVSNQPKSINSSSQPVSHQVVCWLWHSRGHDISCPSSSTRSSTDLCFRACSATALKAVVRRLSRRTGQSCLNAPALLAATWSKHSSCLWNMKQS